MINSFTCSKKGIWSFFKKNNLLNTSVYPYPDYIALLDLLGRTETMQKSRKDKQIDSRQTHFTRNTL